MRGIGFITQKTYFAKPRTKPAADLSIDATVVWAAACAAHRINGTYIKAIDLMENSNINPNRMIMNEFLKDAAKLTTEDFAEGEICRAYFNGYTFKILQGQKLSEFNNTAMLIAQRDVITSSYDIAVIASLPNTMAKSKVRDAVDRRINFASGKLIGKPKDKVQLKVEILKSNWSSHWNIWYTTAITTDDEIVFFGSKNSFTVNDTITIEGKVKAHRDNSTQLNYVKVTS